MNIDVNEKQTVEMALSHNIINKKPTSTLIPLIKHYFSLGYNEEKIKDEIILIMNRNYEGFIENDWIEKIRKWIKSVDKSKDFSLTNITEVLITKNELYTIKNIKNKNLESLCFTMLFHAKVRNLINKNNNDWVCSSTNELFQDAKLSNTRKIKKEKMIAQLIDLELLTPSKSISNVNVKVNFIEHDFTQKDVELTITDFKNFVHDYIVWKGGKLKKCENIDCGNIIIINSNRTKHCKKCSSEHRKAYQRNWIITKKQKIDS